MEKKQIEVCDYYKQLYPEAIVLYHVGDNYVALGIDSNKIARVINQTSDEDWETFVFPCNDQSIIEKLGGSFQIKIIDYRNDDGEFDFPDIQRLKQEEFEDF